MKPGVVHGMPFDAYKAIEAVNHSTLKYMDLSPAHYFEALNSPDREPTPALTLGSAIHTRTLEPLEFEKRYAYAPPCDRRTKAGKETWEAAVAAAGGRTLLNEDDWSTVAKASASVREHVGAKELLAKGRMESVVLWDDPLEGLACKARLDWITEGVIVDLKSAQSAKTGDFSRAIAKYRYHAQAAFYLDGLKAATGLEAAFVFIAVEKDPPYACGVYVASEEMIAQGRKLYRRWLTRLVECRKTGRWPAYSDEIKEITLPAWALREGEDESATDLDAF